MIKSMLKFSFFTALIPVWLFTALVAWFIPWTLVLHTGLLFYFPYSPDGQERFLNVTGPITRLWSDQWVPTNDIPLTCRKALVASEDATFYQHHGIDFHTIQKNIVNSFQGKKVQRGGSTITQQVIKNAFLSRERSYLRKTREITGALLLNLSMSKSDQETWYLNIIEFGPNIYGLEQAANYYFQTKAKSLLPSQCVALMVIVPSPLKWNRSLEKRNITYFFSRRYHTILARMRQMGLDSKHNLREATSLNLWPRNPRNPKVYKDKSQHISAK